jgi:hypothetical protein
MKLINLFTALIQLVTFILNKYSEKRQEKKYEEVRNSPADIWSSGFGVRKETNDDATKTESKQ